MSYDLENRTLNFSRAVVIYVSTIHITLITKIFVDQLIRCSSAVGANYREADGHITKKDLIHKIHLCRKEAKESIYWLNLLENHGNNAQRINIIDEATQLMKILSTIINRIKYK